MKKKEPQAEQKKKKRHILRNILISVLSLIILVYGAAAILIVDFTDNTPSYIQEAEGETITDYLGNKAEKSLEKCGPLDDFEYLFDEKEINCLLSTVVPLISIPIPTIQIKSIYVDIQTDDTIHGEAPFHAFLLRSCAKADGYLSYDETTISLRLSEVKVSHLSSKKGIVKSILSSDTIASIEKAIQDCGVDLTLKRDGDDIYASMTNIDICDTIINCTKGSSIGFLSSALVAGTLNAKNVEVIVNKNGKTGIVIHRRLLL